MSRATQKPVVHRLADLESRVGEVEEPAEQADPKKDDEKGGGKDKGWIGHFSRGQVVASCLTAGFTVISTLVGAYAYLARAPRVMLSFDRSIEVRWDAAERRLSVECDMLANNADGTAGDTLQVVRADLRSQRGLTMRLGKIELRDGATSTSMAGPFFVVKERQSVPVKLTASSAKLPSDAEQIVQDVGVYTLTLEFTAGRSRLAQPSQAYCFYMGKNVADFLLSGGRLRPDPDDRCALREGVIAAGDTRPVER